MCPAYCSHVGLQDDGGSILIPVSIITKVRKEYVVDHTLTQSFCQKVTRVPSAHNSLEKQVMGPHPA